MIALKDRLLNRADIFTQKAYFICKLLPRDETFGIISQLRRAAISVPCNIAEGFARDDWSRSKKDLRRFLEISYGSLEEARYLIRFVEKEYKVDSEYVHDCLLAGDNLGKLLFSFLKKLRNNI